MRYSLVDWTDAPTNNWRVFVGALVIVTPSLAVWWSTWWLAVFYAVVLLPHFGRNRRVRRFKTLDDLKAFVAALRPEHEGDARP